MDATLYNLDAIRSQSVSRTRMEKNLPAQMALGGLVLLRSATLFWLEYGAAMGRCHALLLSGACLPSLSAASQ